MSEVTDSDLLIALIEDQPVLWDKTTEEYKNKHLKTAAWQETYKLLFPGFEEMSLTERTRLGKYIFFVLMRT